MFRLFAIVSIFRGVFSLLRNIRFIIGLLILVVIGVFVYFVFIGDMNVASAGTKILDGFKFAYNWIKDLIVNAFNL